MVLELTHDGVLLNNLPVGPTSRKERLDYYQGGCLAIEKIDCDDRATYECYNRLIADHPKEKVESFRTGLLETVNTLVNDFNWPMHNYYRLRTKSPVLNAVMSYDNYECGKMGIYYNKVLILSGGGRNELEFVENLAKSYSRLEIDTPLMYKEFGVDEKSALTLLYHIVDIYKANRSYYDWFTESPIVWEPVKETTTGLIFV